MCIYCNYHNHRDYSNIYVPDCSVKIDDYVKRSKELDHKILSSMEHGFQGRYFDTYDVAKKEKLKFIFGTEAYWVKDRFEKDKTNGHMCLFAKSEKGRRDINRILSEANETGYYYRPRIDLDLISTLDPNEVFVTSACIAFWQYEDVDKIVTDLHSYFGKNFMLEVQAHHTNPQRELHRRILDLSSKHNIELIAGCDSHYIYPEQAKDRDDVLEAKGIVYENEEGWFMDYPDGDTLKQRFVDQGVLSEVQIDRAIQNTLLFMEFDDYDSDIIKVFSKDIKLPTLYPELTQEQRDHKYKMILNDEWRKAKELIPLEKHAEHIDGIRKEGQVVINTGMSDYFLIDYALVKEAVKNGGIITPTGRGSGVSFYTNTLLGFSKVDRISAPVHLYPERFMSESRILQTKSLPDLDLNLGNPEVFIAAQNTILGEGHAFPMIAYGTFKIKSGFKLYAKSQNLPFEIANEISKQLEKYENELKYAEDDEKDLIDVYDFVEEKYHHLIKESEKYTGIISDKKPHPCAHLLYQGNIREEIGLIMLKSESTKKEVLACLIDGEIAERNKFLKNDLLKVDVVKTTHNTYKRIGIAIHTEQELLNIIKDNKKVWDIYANGLTVGVNQVEKYSTTQKAKKYKPQNISELTAFIAAIRPAFKSMYHTFESRKPFSYGISSFDNLIQTEEMKNSYVLYQEQTMATLAYAGFPSDETYGIIKAISKKKPAVVRPLKDRFIKGFSDKIMEQETVTHEAALEMSDKVWKIIEDSSGYGFNASHAYSYALDSAYCAYLKSHYPIYFYESLLRHFAEKKNKDKIGLLKDEMQRGFGIKDGGVKFGKDNRSFVADEESNSIFADLSGIKYMSTKGAKDLYEASKNTYNCFVDLLIHLTKNTSVDARQIKILIKLNYFNMFGHSGLLTKMYNEFLNGEFKYKTSYVEKTLVTRITKLKAIEEQLKQDGFPELLPNDIVMTQIEHMGYADVKYPDIDSGWCVVTDLDTKYSPKIWLYNLRKGETKLFKMDKKTFNTKNKALKIEKGDMIEITEFMKKQRQVPDGNNGFKSTDQIDFWITRYSKYNANN
ncbi:PHP domain-containing protein [Paenibacillus odorifer]|uniref:PHP domain-containing protein n=1 Tax=Paenibacillus odorifer TaxID=189426 RepID=UPI0009D72039|nr:PHP domain-containing protein [Paenibacillus odorifer]